MSRNEEQHQNDEQQPERSDKSQKSDKEAFVLDFNRALIGGALAGVVALIGALVVGSIGGGEGRVLIQAMLPTTRTFSSTAMIASATILALMLTLLSLSANTNSTLKPIHYRRIRQIALIDVVVFVAAAIFLLLLSIPLEEADKVPISYYDVVYYTMLAIASGLGGAIIAIVLMLYHTVQDMIRVLAPGGSSQLTVPEDAPEEEEPVSS